MSKSDLTERFFKLSILPTIIIGWVFIGLAAMIITARQSNEHADRFERSIESLAKMIETNLWYYDLAAIESSLDSFQSVWNIEGITVIDQYKTVLNASNAQKDDRQPDNKIPIITDQAKIIGELHIWQVEESRMIRNIVSLLPALLVIMLLYAIVVFYVSRVFFRNLVVLPLRLAIDVARNKNGTGNLHLSLASNTTEFDELSIATIRLLAESDDLILKNEKNERKFQHTLTKVFQNIDPNSLIYVLVSDSGSIESRSVGTLISEEDIANLTSNTNHVDKASDERYELIVRDSVKYLVDKIPLEDGHTLILGKLQSNQQWTSKVFDEFIRESGTGMALFNSEDRLMQERGVKVNVLLGRNRENKQPTLSDLLYHFPIVKFPEPDSSEIIDYMASDDQGFKVRLFKHLSGWTCVFHHNVTRERNVERKMIESLHLTELGEVASGVAHDFNNSLAVVIGQLELSLLRDPIERENIEIALKTASQSAKAVKQLMAYSKNQPLNPKIISLSACVLENKSVLQTLLSSDHALVLELEQSQIYVFVDQEKLVSALINLVINAGDAMGHSGTITIRTSKQSNDFGPDIWATVEVIDSGPGIPKSVVNKIFDPFFSTKPVGKGTGLGLSSVKGFVEQSSGIIKLENSTNGAHFRIYFPLAQMAEHDEFNYSKSQRLSIGTDQHELMAVIVDDDQLVLDTCQSLLRSKGMQTAGFSKCADAIEFFKTTATIDCALIDLMMPDMHGLELARVLRTIRPELPILICSGNVRDMDVEAATRIGITHFLHKPYSATEMVTMLKKLFYRSTGNGS